MPSGPRRSAPLPRVPLPGRWALYFIAAIFIIGALLDIPAYLQQWLWMRQLDYLEIFWTLLSVQWGMFVFGFVYAFLFFWSNVHQAARSGFHLRGNFAAEEFAGPWRTFTPDRPNLENMRGWLIPAMIAVSAVVALIFALAFSANWDTYLRYHYGGAYGLRDPLFGIDVGIYLFHLPFYELEQRNLIYLTFITLGCVVAIYLGAGLLQFSGGFRFNAHRNVGRHLSALLFVLIAVIGWGFYLDRYNLVYSTLGVVYGAGYSADHVTRFALSVMQGASAKVCVLLALNFFRPQIKPIAVGAIAYIGLYFIGILLLPTIFQDYIVQPNELALETPYLKNNIAFTRKAYGLDAINETSYPAFANSTPAAITRNQDTIGNIRLWDARPLLQTYHQTQAIRLYYNFYNGDTDRYHLADGYHQVMLSTRELSPQLPPKAQTWVNEHLQFTHGYGVVMNFVSTTAEDGIPQYILENIPAQSAFGLEIVLDPARCQYSLDLLF